MKQAQDTCSIVPCQNKVMYYKPDGRMYCELHNEQTRASLQTSIYKVLTITEYHQSSHGSLTRHIQRKARYARTKLEVSEVRTENGTRIATGATS